MIAEMRLTSVYLEKEVGRKLQLGGSGWRAEVVEIELCKLINI